MWLYIRIKQMLVGIKKASEFLNVSKQTLRRWEREGKITSSRTSGQHRKYEVNDLKKLVNRTDVNNNVAVCYCRVSTKEQQEDLKRQVDKLEMYCLSKGYQYRIISDTGSGLNFNKKGLKELIRLIHGKEVSKIILNYKDRLVMFGFEFFEQLCQLNDIDIEIVNQTEDKTYEEEMVEDVLSILTVYSSRLYGTRSHKQKAILNENKKLFESGKK